MKLCLAIGDRNCEEFVKSSLEKLLTCVTTKGLSIIDPQIQAIYDNPEFDDATKKQKRVEIMTEYFEGHKFLSNLSLTTLRLVKSSGVTSVSFVDEAPYRECVVERCSANGVDVLVLSEMLQGQTHFQNLCQDIKVHCPDVRIIIIGGQHEKGDEFLQGLTQKAIYDITYGDAVNFMDLFKLIFHANTYGDSLKYLNQSQISSEGKETNSMAGAPLKVAPVETPEPKKENKLFGGIKKKEPIQPSSTTPMESTPPQTTPVPAARGTDIFVSEDNSHSSSGTELFSDDEAPRDGLVCYPYDMKPLLVTDRKTKQSFIVNPDGSKTSGENLPAVIKTPRDQMYELYISSLMTDGQNQGIMKEKAAPPTPRQAMSYGVKARSVLFTSSIQGVGCSTMAFNMACLLAEDMKKRVLFIDSGFGESASFARLEIPMDIGISLDELMKDPTRDKDILSKQTLLSYARGNDINRFSCLPDTLSYLTWSKDASANLVWIIENIEMFSDMLTRLSYSYDYIVIDSTLIVVNEVNDALFQFANTIIPVVTQDIYSTNKTANQLHLYDKYNIASKVRVLVNRYEAVPPLTADTFSSDFYNAQVFPILDDNQGFIRAQSQGIPYVTTKTARRKIIKSMRMFLMSYV